MKHESNRTGMTTGFEFPERLLSYWVASLQDQGRREYQEDDLICINDGDVTLMRQQGMLLAVADGMGGMEGGKEASATVVSSLSADFSRMVRSQPVGAQLARMAINASQKVYGKLQGRGGSTLVEGFIFDQRFSWASVGDSFIYLQRGGGIYRVNQDMTVRIKRNRQTLQDGAVDREPGERDPEAACVTGFIGMQQPGVDPEYSRIPLRLRDQDRILICSDGVAGVLADDEILQALRLANPEEACRDLDRRIREKNRKNQDNYTALVVLCSY